MWRKPGRTGAILYAVLAAVLGSATAFFSRLQIERQRGRREAALRLPSGPIIVISNHTSYADGVLLALACRRLGRSLRLLATSGVFSAPLLGTIARRLGFIKVKRGAADAATSLDEAALALEAGEAVGVFPEGRLTRDPMMWPERAKTGAVRLALRTGAPIVPVAMVGAHRVVSRHRVVPTLLGNLIRRPRVDTRIGSPIDVRALMNIGPTTEPTVDEVRLAADAVMGRLVTVVAELRGERPPNPHGVPRTAD
ncbi:MAG TPA: lysophospholipid acyltransferase family protein [Ilumatobacteraceae bacterium]|nr:lysophospholipid acyltransferase family protein [Ilumatobacteraceae bacterium]